MSLLQKHLGKSLWDLLWSNWTDCYYMNKRENGRGEGGKGGEEGREEGKELH